MTMTPAQCELWSKIKQFPIDDIMNGVGGQNL
jgi:hypothetical protein